MGSEKPRILFFLPESRASFSGVLHAQVLAPARVLIDNGFDCLFVGAETCAETAAEGQRRIDELYGIRAHVFSCYSARFGFASMYRTSRAVFQRARAVIQNYRPTHVYYWTFVAAPYGREIARQTGAISIYDIKGIRSEEIALIHGRGLRHHVARRIELREMRRAERLGCVSEKLKEWIKVQTGRDDAIVIPCCIDEKRFVFDSVARQQIRQQFGLAEDTQLLCYNGGLGRWQRIEDIVRLFGEVTHLRPSWRFLFLTREGDALTERVRRMGLPLDRCIITGCPHDQVPRYLSAADVGVIMRHDNVVNNTASPIKIGEYLGCGLPIILTREIGDFAEQIRQAGVGLILDESGHTARQVVDFLDHHGDVRGRAVEFCHRHLVFSAYLDRYRQVFRARAGDGGNGGPAVTVNRHAE